ncbi:MAG TPA: FAD-linked oxidase C-terminal domain-containing protein [Solirubrobacteraceae bacterium]
MAGVSTAQRRRLSEAETARVLDELRDLLGADRVLTGRDVREQHGVDESFHPAAAPDAVVYPTSTDEAAAIVAVCARHRAPLVPFGAGTSLEGHVAALRGGVSVDMREMNRILRLSVEDLDVTVQAGVTRTQLDAALRPEGVFFPVDPGADATLGGMVSTGASGTTTVRYGAMRENVLSLVVVTADGDVVRTRSRARKSSAGYDLTRLFIGAEGTLGLVCEVTLRVHPTPEAMSAAVCGFPRLRDAVDCVVAVSQHGIPVARIELLDEMLIEAINRHDDLDHPIAPTLFLEFHGTPDEVRAQAAETEQLASEHGGEGFRWATDESERRRMWEARHRGYAATQALRPGSAALATDACVPVSGLVDTILQTRADLDEHGLTGAILGHVGDGNFHVTLLVDADDPADVERAMAFHDRLVRRALDHGGTCTGEHGVGYGKGAYLELEHGEAAVRMMRAIKHALDPHDIFNPGKVAAAAPLPGDE